MTALDMLLRDGVREGVAPGLVAVVTGRDGIVGLEAEGVRDVRTGAPMTDDTVFRIASMTKVVTAIAALQLVEDGALDLDAAVGDVLPAFDGLRVLEGFRGDEPVLRPPRRRATVRQLLGHTAGLAYDTWNADLLRYHALTGIPNVGSGRRATFAMPLVADPGERCVYSTAMDWVGLVVERVAGEPLERRIARAILDPLGMRDTTVAPSAAQRARLAAVHERDARGEWRATDVDVVAEPEFYAGGHALHTTAPDFARLQAVLLGDGAPLLGEDTVRGMFRDQAGLPVVPLASVLPAFSADVVLPPGTVCGWGVYVATRDDGPLRRAPGSGGWSGVYNTTFWIDRARGVAAALYAQTLPFYDPAFVSLAERFEAEVSSWA